MCILSFYTSIRERSLSVRPLNRATSSVLHVSFVLLLLLICTPHVMAQGNAAEPGFTDGPDALFFNPAHLHASGANHKIVLRLPGSSAQLGGGLLNVPVYNQYLTKNRTLTTSLQQQMLDEWFPGGRGSTEHAGAEAYISGIGLSYTTGRHAVGLAQRLRMLGQISGSRGLFEVGFGGLDQQLFADETPLDAQLSSALLMQFSAGYSFQVLKSDRSFFFGRPLEIYAGVAPAVLIGYQGLEAKLSSGLQIQGDSLVNHSFTYDVRTHGQLSRQLQNFAAAKAASGPRENPDLSNFIDNPFSDLGEVAGYGFGLNLGIHMKAGLSPRFLDLAFFGAGPRELDVSIGLTDLGSAVYDSDAARFTHSDILEWRGVGLDERWIEQEFEGNADDYLDYVLQDSLGSDVYLSYDVREAGSTTVRLPTRLHLGTQLRAGRAAGHVFVAKGFNQSGLNSRRISFATGLEYSPLQWLPLRAGLRGGGSYGSRFDAGLGIRTGHFELDASASTAISAAKSGSWGGFSLSSRLKF